MGLPPAQATKGNWRLMHSPAHFLRLAGQSSQRRQINTLIRSFPSADICGAACACQAHGGTFQACSTSVPPAIPGENSPLLCDGPGQLWSLHVSELVCGEARSAPRLFGSNASDNLFLQFAKRSLRQRRWQGLSGSGPVLPCKSQGYF